MNKEATLVHDLSPEQINALFADLRNQLAEIKSNFQPKIPVEYLTRQELASMFKCDISSIHNWTVKGKLTAYGIGNRVLYKRHEVETAIIPLKNNPKK